jgi:hypothetical protein
MRFVAMAKSTQVRIKTSSRRRTNSITPNVFRFPSGRGEAAQVEDGIADDLAGAVEGNVAAAVAFEKLDAALGKEFGRGDYVCGFRIAAERDNRRMFKQQQHVADFFFLAQSDQLLLQAQAGGVINGAELD